ncbi:unnamed protein product [Lymnaea stagnalis]|uniref:Uncharacterized protein n=1 Tax=Lymnaea stagnalis TaxID=6523 RepID=A0AAV2ICS1_LYMST
MKGIVLFLSVFAVSYGQSGNEMDETTTHGPGSNRGRGPYRNRWQWRGQGRKNQTVVPREVNTEADDLFQKIFDIVDEVSKGINATKLAQVSQTIKAQADALTGQVTEQEVNDVINEAAAPIDSISATSALFEDTENLMFDIRRIDFALKLLKNLAEEGKKRSDAGQSIDAVAAAISKTSNVLNLILPDFVQTFIYYAETGVLSVNPTDGSENENTDPIKQKRGSICVSWNSNGGCISWSG